MRTPLFFLFGLLSGLLNFEALQAADTTASSMPGMVMPVHPMGVYSVDAYREGDVIHLLTGEYRHEEKTAGLWYRRTTDGGKTWSTPVRVDHGQSPPYNPARGADAQLAAAGQQLVAVWSTGGTGWGGTGPLVTAISTDAGKTWRPGRSPADDNGTGSHGYADLIADSRGFHMVWLDDRGKAQGLYYAHSSDGGRTWSRNMTIDPVTCECCWNTLAAAADQSLYVLFRGSAPRDMFMAALPNGASKWQKLAPVGAFNWRIDACPHTGGALAVRGVTLHGLAWTGAEGKQGVYHVTSSDAGRTWSLPKRLGTSDARHSAIAIANDGSIAAAWDEERADGSIVKVAVSKDAGRSWSAPVLLRSAQPADHPLVFSTRDGFLVLWTEISKSWMSTLKQAMIRSDGTLTQPTTDLGK